VVFHALRPPKLDDRHCRKEQPGKRIALNHPVKVLMVFQPGKDFP
jgi:hypothetical protein